MIKKREKSYRDELIQLSYEYLCTRIKNPKTKESDKLKIAIAISKAGISAHQKHEVSGEFKFGLAELIKKAGKV